MLYGLVVEMATVVFVFGLPGMDRGWLVTRVPAPCTFARRCTVRVDRVYGTVYRPLPS